MNEYGPDQLIADLDEEWGTAHGDVVRALRAEVVALREELEAQGAATQEWNDAYRREKNEADGLREACRLCFGTDDPKKLPDVVVWLKGRGDRAERELAEAQARLAIHMSGIRERGCECHSCKAIGELAALREEFSSYVTRSSDDWMAIERDLAEARALLARCADVIGRAKTWDWEGKDWMREMDVALRDTRAFLDPRRDEALGEPCRCVFRRQGGVDPKCELHGDKARELYEHQTRMEDERKTSEQMREEARRCRCAELGGEWAAADTNRHHIECPARDEARRLKLHLPDSWNVPSGASEDAAPEARDEARRCTCSGLHGEGYDGAHAPGCPARDEARLCTCPMEHLPPGPGHFEQCAAYARDEGER